ncbi:mucolipin-3-like [Geospiza fortis]|uniref:Mucolipin-3-like n=1 Tax=Geospiza fortis TaxID=48883 RepID=A0A8N5I564_GEOFO|nr:mucolipin-3-like [Camarhynchus parvulus]XP_030921339.1 mucolipin-3-like [Geospiza fortis]
MIGHVVTEVVAFVPKLILFRLSNQLVLAFKEDNTVAFKHLLGYKDGTSDTQAIYTCRNLLEHLAFVLKKAYQQHQPLYDIISI